MGNFILSFIVGSLGIFVLLFIYKIVILFEVYSYYNAIIRDYELHPYKYYKRKSDYIKDKQFYDKYYEYINFNNKNNYKENFLDIHKDLEVLGLEEMPSNLSELKQAYRIKAKKHHPDLGGDEKSFHMINNAYHNIKKML